MTAGPAARISALFDGEPPDDADWLSLLIRNGLDRLPLPGSGQTLDRWRALAAVGRFDLSLAKLYEGHTDALAILAELGESPAADAGGSWCVWAAEAPGGRTLIHDHDDGGIRLGGAKHWCSGAASCDHALLTAWDSGGAAPQLVAVELSSPGISIDADAWKAVGMASSMSLNVRFDAAKARRIGKPGEYLSRPGFWQGGAGVAACWWGGATGIADALRRQLLGAARNDASGFKLASLGRAELAIEETAAVLKLAARWIDAHPAADASRVALAARLSAERCAKLVLDEAGKAMGAAPFGLDEKFATAAADLPVFIRQSHADRDFAALGERSLQHEAREWWL